MTKKVSLIIFFSLLITTFVSAEVVVDKKGSLGGQLASGNTKLTALHFDFLYNRNYRFIDEWTLKGSFDQASSAGTETMFKASTSLRYGHSISKKLYGFYKLGLEHDRFQSLDLRVLPTVGVGYWFLNQSNSIFMIESALGYQKNYFSNQSITDSGIINLRAYYLKGILSNNFNLYTALNDLADFRVINEIILKSKLTQHYSFKIILKDEYNHKPLSASFRNDLSMILGIEYLFQDKK